MAVCKGKSNGKSNDNDRSRSPAGMTTKRNKSKSKSNSNSKSNGKVKSVHAKAAKGAEFRKVTRVGEREDVSRDYVLDLLVSTINRCRQAEPVVVRGVVVPGEYQFDVANALRATEMLGRHLKMFTDKVEHSGKVTLEALVVGLEEAASS